MREGASGPTKRAPQRRHAGALILGLALVVLLPGALLAAGPGVGVEAVRAAPGIIELAQFKPRPAVKKLKIVVQTKAPSKPTASLPTPGSGPGGGMRGVP